MLCVKFKFSLSLSLAVCPVLAGAWLTAVWTHGSGVSVHVSGRGRRHSSVSGQECHQGELFNMFSHSVPFGSTNAVERSSCNNTVRIRFDII